MERLHLQIERGKEETWDRDIEYGIVKMMKVKNAEEVVRERLVILKESGKERWCKRTTRIDI